MPSLTSATSFICAGVSGVVAKIVRAAYLDKDHGRDLLGGELLGLAEVGDLDHGAAVLVDDLEGPRLDVLLDGLVFESATDQSPAQVSTQIQKRSAKMAART